MQDNNQPQVRERIRVGDYEVEVEGTPDYVRSRINELLNLAIRGNNVGEPNVPEKKQLVRVDDGMPSVSEATETVDHLQDVDARELNPPDLLDFYQEKSPTQQKDIVLIIAYFYQKYRGHDSLSVETFQEGFKALKKAAVKEPPNCKSSVRNVVHRTEFLYNPERGKFSLTLQGEQYVESLPNQEEV